jgi:hypothetical protein
VSWAVARGNDPFYRLCDLIEQATGVASDQISLATRQLLEDKGPWPQLLPDFQWVYAKLNECDANGTTVAILTRFEEKRPGILAAYGLGHTQGVATQTETPPTDSNKKGKRIDERMLAAIRDEAEAVYWSAKEWAEEHLHCAKSTIVESRTWKQICMPARERERLARGKRLRGPRKKRPDLPRDQMDSDQT